MQLIGYLDSPFVRRVAITMRFLGVAYEHREVSIFRQYDEFRKLHPAVKVPLLILDDGTRLIDSGLIIDYLQTVVAGRSLMPADSDDYVLTLQATGNALVVMEKIAQLIYETGHRPADLQHPPWIARIEEQLYGACQLMEDTVSAKTGDSTGWLFGTAMTQADIATAVVWRFMQHIDVVDADALRYPALAAFSTRAEQLPEFKACPLSG